MRPPKCSTIWRLIGKPEPGALRPVRRHRRPGGTSRRSAHAASAGTPGPLSCTATVAASASTVRRIRYARPASGTNLAALLRRFSSTCISRSGSARKWEPRRAARGPAGAAFAQQLPDGLRRLPDQRDQVDVGVVPLGVAGLDLRHVEHLVHEPAQALGLGDDDAQELLALRRGHLGVVDHQLGQCADGGQRRAQLVRHAGHEVVLQPVQPFEAARWRRAARRWPQLLLSARASRRAAARPRRGCASRRPCPAPPPAPPRPP